MTKVALVTGGVARVGWAVAQALAYRGLRVLVTTRTHAPAHAARTGSGSIEIVQADVTTDAGLELVRSAVGTSLCVLVHNASQYDASPIGAITRASVEASFAIHGVAPILLTQALLPALRRGAQEHGDASVVAMLDIHAQGRPRANRCAYLAGKAALGGIVDALALDLAPSIRVNGVAPGVVAWDSGASDGERTQYESRIPLERPGTPRDAADAVCWLALDAKYTTGTVLRVDGGRALR